jgi:hypothetical protein
MHNLQTIILLLGAAGSLIFPISTIFSRTYSYAPWAKLASILVCLLGLAWSVGGLVLPHLDISIHVSIVLNTVRRDCVAVASGLLLSVIIAKPYKKIAVEKNVSAQI